MADDEDWYKPNRAPRPSRQATPGELLFEFHVAATHAFYRVELRDHGAYGFEAQFLDPVDLRIAHVFSVACTRPYDSRCERVVDRADTFQSFAWLAAVFFVGGQALRVSAAL